METIAIIVSIVAMFLWVRTEANADRRNMQEIQREDRKDILSMIAAIKEDVQAIRADVRGFQDRLCEIERNRKG